MKRGEDEYEYEYQAVYKYNQGNHEITLVAT
jgi:hypothetical protein